MKKVMCLWYVLIIARGNIKNNSLIVRKYQKAQRFFMQHPQILSFFHIFR